MPNPVAIAADHFVQTLANVFLTPGSTFSLWSLACALVIAAGALLSRRRVRPRVLLRALFPAWLWRSRSSRADMGFFLLNVFVSGTLVGWGILSYGWVVHGIDAITRGLIGHGAWPVAPLWLREAVMTVALFLAYDFGYWLDHYLKHKVPAFWEFHRVHHTAEKLSPLTAYRVHPVDSLIFTNIVTVIMGAVGGALPVLMGAPSPSAMISGTNLILVVFIFAVIHLQHSHIDIRFTGTLGKWLFSPAHHQIHHSDEARHFDRNMGSCLAVWDWMFGTLVIPTRAEKPAKYGVGPLEATEKPHSAQDSLLTPFVRAAQILVRGIIRIGQPSGFQPGE